MSLPIFEFWKDNQHQWFCDSDTMLIDGTFNDLTKIANRKGTHPEVIHHAWREHCKRTKAPDPGPTTARRAHLFQFANEFRS